MNHKGQGSILIMSLWILSIVTLLASGIAFMASQRLRIITSYSATVQDRYIQWAAFTWSTKVLLENNTEVYQSLNQGWSENKAYLDAPIEKDLYDIIYEEVDIDGHILKKTGVTDEERKININFATKIILMNLPDATEEVVDAIVDWRDEDHRRERYGAEDDDYQNADPPYEAKDSFLESLEELFLIKGFSEDLYKKWRPFITEYGDGRVNINTASREVMLILGLDENLADKIIEFRIGEDRLEGSADDGVFKDEGAIARTLFESEPLNSNEVSQLINLVSKGLLGVKSTHFSIETELSQSRSGQRKIVNAIVEQIEKDIKLKSWSEE